MKKQCKIKEVSFHELVRQKEKEDKKLRRFEALIGFLSVIIMLALMAFAAFIGMKFWLRVIVMTCGLAIGFFGLLAAISLEGLKNYYVCHQCKERIVPMYRNINLAPHIGTTRYIRCDSCKENTKEKKEIIKA